MGQVDHLASLRGNPQGTSSESKRPWWSSANTAVLVWPPLSQSQQSYSKAFLLSIIVPDHTLTQFDFEGVRGGQFGRRFQCQENRKTMFMIECGGEGEAGAVEEPKLWVIRCSGKNEELSSR